MAMDQYLLIPFFSGMNIHLPAILMWTTGVQGFDTLPYQRVVAGLLRIIPVQLDPRLDLLFGTAS